MTTSDEFDTPYQPVGGRAALMVSRRLIGRRGEIGELLRELVEIESPSGDPHALTQMADRLEAKFGELDEVAHYPSGATRHLLVTVEGSEPGLSPTLVIGHFDTVWDHGTIDRMPFSIAGGVATGPGCFDMKGGIVALYYGLREARSVGREPRRRLRVLLTCDEEAGSPSSRNVIEEVGSDVAAALVLEPPLPGGALKTARKGTSHYRVKVYGQAAHSGIEPERGASAILELANQIRKLHALGDQSKGTTINVGTIRGGTRANVVAAHAEAAVEVRASTAAEAERVGTAINKLEVTVPGTRLSIISGTSRPPMERTPASGLLFARAKAIAAEMGIANLSEGATGGASDGNLVSAMGIPTLDGLGPEGGGAHANNEHVLLDSILTRAALIAGLAAEI